VNHFASGTVNLISVQRGIPNVMLNTNGKRIATDDRFLAELAQVRPNIYF
jgi:hypothetical protein